jgi:hypothetical protein
MEALMLVARDTATAALGIYVAEIRGLETMKFGA